jgi:ABC-3C biological conflict system middle component
VILPNKHVSAEASLIGIGAVILGHVRGGQTVSRLWERVRAVPEVRTFDRLVIALDFLYAIGAVEYQDGLIRRPTS